MRTDSPRVDRARTFVPIGSDADRHARRHLRAEVADGGLPQADEASLDEPVIGGDQITVGGRGRVALQWVTPPDPDQESAVHRWIRPCQEFGGQTPAGRVYVARVVGPRSGRDSEEFG